MTFQESSAKTGTLSSGPKADQDLSYSREIAPNATFTINYAYGNPTGTGSTTTTLAYTSTVVKQYQTSQISSAPKIITTSGTYEGGGTGYDYFAIQLSQPSFVKVSMDGDATMKRLSNYETLEISSDGKTIDTRKKRELMAL